MCHSWTRLRPQTTRRVAPPLKPPGPSLPGRGESRSGLAHGSSGPARTCPCPGVVFFSVFVVVVVIGVVVEMGWGGGQVRAAAGDTGARTRWPSGSASRRDPTPPTRLRPSPRPRPRPLGPHAGRAVLPSLSPVKPSGLGALLLLAAANLCLSSRGSSEPNVSEGTSLSAPRPSKSLPCAD